MSVRGALSGVRWYLRELTGEAKWDDYVAACARAGTTPMNRRDFERARVDHAERHPGARCC